MLILLLRLSLQWLALFLACVAATLFPLNVSRFSGGGVLYVRNWLVHARF